MLSPLKPTITGALKWPKNGSQDNGKQVEKARKQGRVPLAVLYCNILCCVCTALDATSHAGSLLSVTVCKARYTQMMFRVIK